MRFEFRHKFRHTDLELEIPYDYLDDEWRTCSECGATVRRHSYERDAYVPSQFQDPRCELNCGTWIEVHDKNVGLDVVYLLEAPVEEIEDGKEKDDE